jgi:hypothetical protein
LKAGILKSALVTQKSTKSSQPTILHHPNLFFTTKGKEKKKETFSRHASKCFFLLDAHCESI